MSFIITPSFHDVALHHSLFTRHVVWLVCHLFSFYFNTYFPQTIGFKRLSYSELKKATKKFSEEIGRGAGGIVYKGILSDNRVAGVKKLHVANQGEAEFLAEVNTIGELHHMNLIEMLGYCVEGKHRILVYEYMEHGSLVESLSNKELDWEKRFGIALGTASQGSRICTRSAWNGFCIVM